MIRAIDVANLLLARYGQSNSISNISLNKLVYLTQVEALKENPSAPLFNDPMQAWDYGPVVPNVYHEFKHYGRNRVLHPGGQVDLSETEEAQANRLIDKVMDKFGDLTAFDLVELTHQKGGAWRNVYVPNKRNINIEIKDILASKDYTSEPDLSRTFAAGLRNVSEKWPNAIRLLQDA